MVFRELFERMHRFDPSLRGGALAGSDGMTVEEWTAAEGGPDLPALCAELVQILREGGRVARENRLGEADELSLSADGGLVFLARVSEDYFLLAVTGPDALPGKWRFLLRQAARRARELL